MIYIFKSTLKRANPFASYTDENGVRYARIPRELLDEVPEPQPPEDYSEDAYFRVEVSDAPYVVYERKAPEQIAAQRWERLKQIRDDLTDNGGCSVAGKWFHTDSKSKQQQMALTMLGANLPAGLMWKTMDGSFIEMTPALVQQLFAAQVQREQVIFTIAETKRLDDTPINEGWPDRYVDPEALS